MPNEVRANSYRAIRWAVAAALLVACVVALLNGWFEVCSLETTKSATENASTRKCGAPAVTDAGTVAVAFLILLLLIPDMSEVGIFGLSMKRRVEAAEKQASESKEQAGRLEDRLLLQTIRIDGLNQAVANSTAQASIGDIIIGDAAIKKAVSGLPQKEAAYKRGADEEALPAADATPAPDAELTSRVIRNWESIAASLDLPPYRPGVRASVSRDPISTTDAKRFVSLFREELNVVRATRNTVAHAGSIADDDLLAAVEISERLLAILRDGTPHD